MSNHFPPTPAELIGIVLSVAFWAIEFIIGVVTGQPPIWLVALLGLGATGVIYVARRRAAELVTV